MRQTSDNARLGYILQVMKIKERLRNCYRLEETGEACQPNIMWYLELAPGKRKQALMENWGNLNKVCKLVNSNILTLGS